MRNSDHLLDVQQFAQAGTVLVILEPLHKGGLARALPGSKCMLNAYTSNHAELQRPDIGTGRALALHAMLLRFQALLMPFKQMFFDGAH